MSNFLKALLIGVKKQVLGGQSKKSSERKKVVVYTKNCVRRMKENGLSPEDVEDVFWKGTKLKENALVRQLNGFQIGIYYFGVIDAGLYVVTTVWKNDRK